VLVIDDHVLYREGVTLLLRECFEGVDVVHADDLAGALVALSAEPDIALVVLELTLRDSRGADSLSVLRMVAPSASLAVISSAEEPATILAALNYGACGYIPKALQVDAIEAAFRALLRGEVYLPPQLFRHLQSHASDAASDLDLADRQAEIVWRLGLTPRQVDVLRLLVAGLPTKAIARQMGLAESSVKTHLIGLFRRLDVTSRVQAVLAATEAGLRFDR
jgi:DNA-binding NarL/FixJ family response regulator